MKLTVQEQAQQAITAFNEKRRKDSVEILNDLVKKDADLGNQWAPLANIAFAYGEIGVMRHAAQKVLAVNPNEMQRHLGLIGMLAELGQLDEALSYLKPLIALHPKDPAINHFYATIMAQKGNHTSALQHMRRTFETWPASGQTWLLLANMKTFTKGDKDLKQMESLRTLAANSTPDNHAPFLYALAKAYCDIGEYDVAFKHYFKAAQMVEGDANNQPIIEEAFLKDVQEKATPEAIAKLKEGSNPSTRPIFVMGSPRSGSTLVEQILASHSKVRGGAELNLFRVACQDMEGFGVDHAISYYEENGKSGKAWDALAENYLHLLDERFGPADEVTPHIVDKTLNNSRFMIPLAKALPNAPILWMRRNAADTALSCFRTFFNQGLMWSWNFANIARYLKVEDALFEHWNKVFPGRILEVPYEALVDNPKTWIPKILEHCGLPNEKGVFTPHRTKREVLTSSVEQVRKPINKKAVGRGERYRKYMEAFHQVYGS